MAPKKIKWYDEGPAAVVYEPGPSSLDFIREDFGRGKDDTAVVPFSLKLCMLMNDAIVQRQISRGLDGFFFFSIGTEPLGLGKTTIDEYEAHGPQIYFAEFTLSAEERSAWQDTDLQGKLELCSLYWKHEALSDVHMVLPIWLPFMPPRGYSDLPSGAINTNFSISRKEQGEHVAGALVGMVEDRIFVTAAEDFRSRCAKVAG